MMKPTLVTRKNNPAANGSRAMSEALDSNTCQSVSPAPMSPVRVQRQAAITKSTSVPNGGPSGDDGNFRGMTKTVGVPHANAIFKKKAGSMEASNPRSQSSVFATPSPMPPPGTRNKTNHTDPFSEDRIRDIGKQKKLLTPKPKTPRNISIRTKTDFRPADAKENTTRSTIKTKKESSKSTVFNNQEDETATNNGLSPTPEGSLSPPASPSRRFKYSSQGNTSMSRADVKDADEAPKKPCMKINEGMRKRQSLDGVMSVAQITKNKKSLGYKFVSPFARQLSSTITVSPAPQLSVSRRNKSKPSETFKTPFARDNSYSVGSKPRAHNRTFHTGHIAKTPFARHESTNVSQTLRTNRRVAVQAKTDPFAKHY